METKTIAAMTLGCKVNLYDTEAMLSLFVNHGYEIVEFGECADVYLINTCTVTSISDKKSRQMIRKTKKQNPDALVVVTGCYAQVSPEEIEQIEEVNLVLGTKDRDRIVELVEEYAPERGIINQVSDVFYERDFERLPNAYFANHLKRTRAYVKIQEGCNQFCAYCIIPYARGRIRSKRVEDVLAEICELGKNGFREIVLAGIHVASYGKDVGDVDLPALIQKVAALQTIERIRVSSIEPMAITPAFLEMVQKTPILCDHFHLSLQSGCDQTLARMNRNYVTEQYKQSVQQLREICPDVCITTDMIVGFPGETDQEFGESFAFAETMELAKIHVFPYSRKKGTKAFDMPEQVPQQVKNERAATLLALSNRLSRAFLQRFVGRAMPVLFETKVDTHTWEGHTSNYILVRIQAEENMMNQIRNVTITGLANDSLLLGEVEHL